MFNNDDIFGEIVDSLKSQLKINMKSLIRYQGIYYIEAFFPSRETLIQHCVFLFFLRYRLRTDQSVPLGRFIIERYSGDKLFPGSNRVADYPLYQDMRRYFKKRAELHDTKYNSKIPLIDLEIADFIVNIRKNHLVMNSFEDTFSDSKNLSNKEIFAYFDYLNKTYKDILDSKDSYFIKSCKFFQIEHLTYFEHYYLLAQKIKKFDKEKNEFYSYNAFNLRYMRSAEDMVNYELNCDFTDIIFVIDNSIDVENNKAALCGNI